MIIKKHILWNYIIPVLGDHWSLPEVWGGGGRDPYCPIIWRLRESSGDSLQPGGWQQAHWERQSRGVQGVLWPNGWEDDHCYFSRFW